MAERILTKNFILGKTRLDSVASVKNLNFWGQELNDVSIISEMPNVEVVSLSVNNIDTLKPFENCYKLRELYLRKNKIENLSEIEYLKDLKALQVLWLSGNPCADEDGYRLRVIAFLDNLTKLDDDDISPEEKELAKKFKNLELPGSSGMDRRRSPSPQNSPTKDRSPTTPSMPVEEEVMRPPPVKPRQGQRLARTPPKKFESPTPVAVEASDTPEPVTVVRRVLNTDNNPVTSNHSSRNSSPSVRESALVNQQKAQQQNENFSIPHIQPQSQPVYDDEPAQRVLQNNYVDNQSPQPVPVRPQQVVTQERRLSQHQQPVHNYVAEQQNYVQHEPIVQQRQPQQNVYPQAFQDPRQHYSQQPFNEHDIEQHFAEQQNYGRPRSRWDNSPTVQSNLPYFPSGDYPQQQQPQMQPKQRRYSNSSPQYQYPQKQTPSLLPVNRNTIMNVVFDLVHELDPERLLIIRQEIDRILMQ